MAIRIWLKLKNSIPLRYKKYYSLLPDPAAGKVTVVARTPSLELPGLWSNKTGGEHSRKATSSKLRTALPSLADHVAFVPVTPAVSGFAAFRLCTNDDSVAMSFRSFNFTRQRLLGRTWVTLADQCGLVLGSSQDHEDVYGTKLEREEEDETRFSVESDMNANALTPLRMNWAQFVWLSLALGVRPYDSAWKKNYPCTLKDTKGNAFITLFESDGQLFAMISTERDISYSLNRAFAWHNIILEAEGLMPLGWQHKPHVSLSSVQISPGLSNLLSPEDLANDPDSVLRGKEAQDCEDPLASACRWMLYHRRHRSITGNSIPVSQQMMEFRERTLCHLYILDKRGLLEEKIRLLITTPRDPAAMDASDEKMARNESRRDTKAHTSSANNGHMRVVKVPTRDSSNPMASPVDAAHEEERHSPEGDGHSEHGKQAVDGQTIVIPCDGVQLQKDCLTSATQMEPMIYSNSDDGKVDGANGLDLHVEPLTVINPQSTNPITSSSTRPTKEGLPTHDMRQDQNSAIEPAAQLSASQSKVVSTILDSIRSVLAASNYVKRFGTLLSIRSEILHMFFQLLKPVRKCDRFRRKELAETIEASFSLALARLARFSNDCKKLDTLIDHNCRRPKITDIYELLPQTHRARLEEAVLAEPSPSSILRSDGPHDTHFIASIALATAEWDTAIQRTWSLNVDAMDRYEALTSTWHDATLYHHSLNPDSLDRHKRRKCLASQDSAELDNELAATALINDGLYNASKSSELDTLLTKEVRNVCLL